MKDNAKENDIINAGETALVFLYNGNSGNDLDALRYKRFQEKVMKSFKFVDAKDLPPTSALASSIVLGCTTKSNSGEKELDISTQKNGVIMPVTIDMPPAPNDLLRVFRCKCKRPVVILEGVPARSMG